MKGIAGAYRLVAAVRTAALVVTTALVAIAPPALAAGDAHGPTTMDLVWQAINLAILLVVLFVLARKPVQAYFAERRNEIKNDIEAAANLLDDGERRFKEWQGKIVDLGTELETIRSDTRLRAEQERELIVAAAHDSADRIKADAMVSIEQETRRAQAELRKEAAHLAVDLAEEILRNQVEDRDRDRLADEFITRIEPGGSTAGTGR
jgi:F-type H+-transporting ATPase subunit b